MTTVWYRDSPNKPWRPASQVWMDIDEERAHGIADRYNKKHGYGMWWVSESRPGKDKVPDGKQELEEIP